MRSITQAANGSAGFPQDQEPVDFVSSCLNRAFRGEIINGAPRQVPYH